MFFCPDRRCDFPFMFSVIEWYHLYQMSEHSQVKLDRSLSDSPDTMQCVRTAQEGWGRGEGEEATRWQRGGGREDCLCRRPWQHLHSYAQPSPWQRQLVRPVIPALMSAPCPARSLHNKDTRSASFLIVCFRLCDANPPPNWTCRGFAHVTDDNVASSSGSDPYPDRGGK